MPFPRIMNPDDEPVLEAKIAIAESPKGGYANMRCMLTEINLVGKGKLYLPWVHAMLRAPDKRPDYAVRMSPNLRAYIHLKPDKDDIRWSPLEQHADRVHNLIVHEENHRVNPDERTNRYRTFLTTGDSMELEMFVPPRPYQRQMRYPIQ